MKYIKPKNIRILNDDGFFRLAYDIKDGSIKTKGFRNRKELAEIIEDDNLFKIKIDG